MDWLYMLLVFIGAVLGGLLGYIFGALLRRKKTTKRMGEITVPAIVNPMSIGQVIYMNDEFFIFQQMHTDRSLDNGAIETELIFRKLPYHERIRRGLNYPTP